jgi:hypothetical protein
MNTNTTKTSAIKVKTSIKAGGFGPANHNRGLKVTTAIKAGGFGPANHNRALVRA